MEKDILVNALFTNERIKILRANDVLMETDSIFYDQWDNINGLSGKDHTIELQKYRDNKFEEFIYVLNINDDEENSFLYEYLKQQGWYKEFNKIFSCHTNFDSLKYFDDTIQYTIRPFLNDFVDYIHKVFKKLNRVSINENVVMSLTNYIASELCFYNIKLVVSNLDKENAEKTKSFQEFLKLNYKHTILRDEMLKNPVMTRLMTERYLNLKRYFKEVLFNINEIFHKLEEQFSLSSSTITKIECSLGDTHESGKSVLLIEFDETTLVYKPKNLFVEKAYYNLLNLFNQNYSLGNKKFYIMNQRYEACYTISEYIQKKPCKNNDELKSYYQSIGNLIVILHILNGNDIHFENIIATGKKPVIVDLETLMHDTKGLFSEVGDVSSQIIEKNQSSVLRLGILPFIGLKENESGKGIDISGINCKQQTLPFESLVLVNQDTNDMRFKLKQEVINPKNNVPEYKNKKVFYQEFQDEIIKGFMEMSSIIFLHKEKILKKIVSLFGSDKKLRGRVLIRPTAGYSHLQMYSNHPNYLKDMICYERLLENFMAYPFKNREVIKFELEALYKKDIPIFFRAMDDKHLYDSDGVILFDYFERTPLDNVKENLLKWNNDMIQEQLHYIKVALKYYETNYDAFLKRINDSKKLLDSSTNYSNCIDEVAKMLIDGAIYSSDLSDLTWSYADFSNHSVLPVGSDNINGLLGIGLSLHMYINSLCEPLHSEKCLSILNNINNT